MRACRERARAPRAPKTIHQPSKDIREGAGGRGDVPKNIVGYPPKIEKITPVLPLLVLQVAKKNARGARLI
jgi:hypothetical protein